MREEGRRPFTVYDLHPYRRREPDREPDLGTMNVADFARAVFGEPPG